MSTTANLRQARIALALQEIRALHAQAGITPESLARTAQRLDALAREPGLFSFAEFPLPEPGGALSNRYELQVGDDGAYALYLQALLPGKRSVPHNHGTWVAVAAIQGEELNRRYQRDDAGGETGPARLRVVGEHTVRPGNPVFFEGDDIHSIHVVADAPALHLHLYGRALETLTTRLAFDLDTGAVTRYNQTHWRASLPGGAHTG